MPENDGEPARAGLPRHLAAVAYDALILFALFFIATFVLMQVRGGALDATGKGILQLLCLAITYLYFVWFWTHGGQTVGMRAWRIQLLGPDRAAPRWSAASLRFLMAALSWLPAAAGFWWALLDPDRATWHDRISRTRLVMRAK